MNRLVIITGQTATGKTKLSVKYAKKYNGEVINADSRQVYKYLDIVSGKDSHYFKESGVKVWLYDAIDPKNYFSSYEFQKQTRAIVKDILRRGKTPIIVGGTYFYIKHLLYGIETGGVPANWNLRESLGKASVGQLQKKLKKIAPKLYLGLNNSEKNNPQRLIRKIEIAPSASHNQTGLDFKPIWPQKNVNLTYLGLHFKKKSQMEKAIEARVLERIEDGAIEEVRALLNCGYKITDPGMQANACAEIAQYIRGEVTLDRLKERWITLERQYARRQYTFMKRDPNIRWKII